MKLAYSVQANTTIRWRSWSSFFATVLFVHFSISSVGWLNFLSGAIRDPWMRVNASTFLHQASPSFVLWMVSLALLVASLRGRFVARQLGLVVLASLIFFWMDVSFGFWQFRVDIADRQYWNYGGREHTYFNWWWFNDRMFKGRRWFLNSQTIWTLGSAIIAPIGFAWIRRWSIKHANSGSAPSGAASDWL